ncbi:MAG: Ku protein [Candidatus Rokubacteria bacterium]|nr:Ku protein [Candidatus Rokubacteria bacterium]
MPRPMWKGAVTFGLVSVPVNLHPATRRQADLSFRMLHEKDKAPIQYKKFCSEEDTEVPWAEIVKGYEFEKGQFVVMSDEDFEKAKTESTETLDIREFVPLEQINVAHFESAYWLEPTKQGRKAYALLREALVESGRVGVGTFVMRQREHLAVLRPAGKALMLTTMRFADEIRSAEDLNLPGDEKLGKKEIELAKKLVDTLAADWDPEEYKDTYHETLRAAIEQKLEGREVEAPAAKRPARVVHLMKALEESSKTGARKPPARASGRGEPKRAARGKRSRTRAA